MAGEWVVLTNTKRKVKSKSRVNKSMYSNPTEKLHKLKVKKKSYTNTERKKKLSSEKLPAIHVFSEQLIQKSKLRHIRSIVVSLQMFLLLDSCSFNKIQYQDTTMQHISSIYWLSEGRKNNPGTTKIVRSHVSLHFLFAMV